MFSTHKSSSAKSTNSLLHYVTARPFIQAVNLLSIRRTASPSIQFPQCRMGAALHHRRVVYNIPIRRTVPKLLRTSTTHFSQTPRVVARRTAARLVQGAAAGRQWRCPSGGSEQLASRGRVCAGRAFLNLWLRDQEMCYPAPPSPTRADPFTVKSRTAPASLYTHIT